MSLPTPEEAAYDLASERFQRMVSMTPTPSPATLFVFASSVIDAADALRSRAPVGGATTLSDDERAQVERLVTEYEARARLYDSEAQRSARSRKAEYRNASTLYAREAADASMIARALRALLSGNQSFGEPAGGARPEHAEARFLQVCLCPQGSEGVTTPRCPIHGEPQLGTLTTSHQPGDATTWTAIATPCPDCGQPTTYGMLHDCAGTPAEVSPTALAELVLAYREARKGRGLKSQQAREAMYAAALLGGSAEAPTPATTLSDKAVEREIRAGMMGFAPASDWQAQALRHIRDNAAYVLSVVRVAEARVRSRRAASFGISDTDTAIPTSERIRNEARDATGQWPDTDREPAGPHQGDKE